MQRVLTALALVAAIVLAVPAIRHWREQPPAPPPPPQPLSSAWTPPDGLEAGGGGDYSFGLALAPDGRRLVFPAAKSGVVSLWLHDLRNGETRALPGTDGAVLPFWSPNGSWIGFFSNGKVRVLNLENATTSELADAASPRGGSWSRAGDLVFAPSPTNGILLLDSKGSIRTLTHLDVSQGDTSHSWPAFLPDGRHVIYLNASQQSTRAGIWLTSLDDASSAQRLFAADSQAVVAGGSLVYANDLSLVAQPIDPVTFMPGGRATVVGLNAGRGPLRQVFATASSEVLIFGAPGNTLRDLRWVSRDGKPVGPVNEPVDAWDLRIAPDTRRFVVTEIDRQLRTLDVFIRTSSQPAPRRLSLSTDADESGAWSPDGRRIAWASQRRKVMIRGAGAVLAEQTIATFDTPVQVWDWSRDARSLLIGRKSNDTGDDLWIQPPTEGAAAQPYTTAPFDQTFGAFSPDGQWMAYASNESGQFDVYVDSYPTPGHRVRLTTNGGTEPRWSADGRELYFRRGSEIHAIVLDRSEVRSTAKLFDAGAAIRAYDVSRDGRFLLNLPADNHAPLAATIVSHWSAFANTLRRDESVK